MNKSHNENFNDPAIILNLLYKTYDVIINRLNYKNKNTGKEIGNDTLKSLYAGFYSAYIKLMESKIISDTIKKDLIAKKQILDIIFKKNITDRKKNKELNVLNSHKSVANRINTSKLLNNSKLEQERLEQNLQKLQLTNNS
jgi:serine/threonine protein kinase HipA of HipAB toxin-antitoxin module